MRKIEPHKIERNAIDLIGRQKMLITAGDSIENFNMMTANWGMMGELWFKPVAYIFVRPQRYTNEFIAKNEVLTLSFFDDTHSDILKVCGTKSGREIDKINLPGLTPYMTSDQGISFREASTVLECRKLYIDTFGKENFLDTSIVERCYPEGDFHDVYIVEIVGAWVAK